MDLVTELAKSPALEDLAPMPKRARELRGYEELVTRLFAYGDGLEEYRDRPAEFVFAYSKKMNGAFSAEPGLADDYRQRFDRVIRFVSQNFPFGFRKTAKGKATPRSRFESIAIGVDRALAEHPELDDLSPDDLDVEAWLSLPEFQRITSSDGANAVARLRGRIDFVRERLVQRASG